MEKLFDDKVAIVSGAGAGIGKACVNLLADRGWHVFALDRDDSVRRAFATPRVTALHVDIADDDALRAAWERVTAQPSALINAAGVFPPSSLPDLTRSQYRKVFDINVFGTILLSQLASRTMIDGGAIVNLSSTNGFVGRPDQILYAASKAAILSLTRSMAVALAGRRIRVNCIAPGPVDTQGFRAIHGRAEEAMRQAPLHRIQEAEEVAEIALWLIAGRGAQYITGETIVSSGGMFMR